MERARPGPELHGVQISKLQRRAEERARQADEKKSQAEARDPPGQGGLPNENLQGKSDDQDPEHERGILKKPEAHHSRPKGRPSGTACIRLYHTAAGDESDGARFTGGDSPSPLKPVEARPQFMVYSCHESYH